MELLKWWSPIAPVPLRTGHAPERDMHPDCRGASSDERYLAREIRGRPADRTAFEELHRS